MSSNLNEFYDNLYGNKPKPKTRDVTLIDGTVITVPWFDDGEIPDEVVKLMLGADTNPNDEEQWTEFAKATNRSVDNVSKVVGGFSPEDYDYALVRQSLPEYFRGLTDNQLKQVLDTYANVDDNWFNDEYSVDLSQIRSDYDEMLAALANEPVAPDFQTYLNDARNTIASENQAIYDDLDRLLGEQTSMYNDQMSSISKDYDRLSSNLLAQQYQQSAQLMDTLTSGMEKSRRNALEAGASAGIRIADNINTLLTVQNKQSATSMETANQLSQMMINKRNAEFAARSDYNKAMSDNMSNKHSLQLGSESRASSLANNNYTAANDTYSKKYNTWDNSIAMNPLYGHMGNIKGSKYN